MDYWKKKTKLMGIAAAAVCLAAVCMSVFSIYSTNQMRQTASMIYDHPYTVSNESRSMQSRLLDMRSFLLDLVADPSSDVKGVKEKLEERYAMQYDSIEVITSKYMGPGGDIAALLAAMRDLEQTQNEALPVILPMGRDETARYVERNLYPKYDAVNTALTTVIDYADSKVQGLEHKSADMAAKAVASATLLTIFLPAFSMPVTDRRVL